VGLRGWASEREGRKRRERDRLILRIDTPYMNPPPIPYVYTRTASIHLIHTPNPIGMLRTGLMSSHSLRV